MPELSYDRVVRRVQIEREGDGAIVRFGSASCVLNEQFLDDLSHGWSLGARRQLAEQGFTAWSSQEDQNVMNRWQHPTPGVEVQPVLELIVDRALTGLPWEAALTHVFPLTVESSIVRSCPVPARVDSWPLVLPIRLLQVAGDLPSLERRVRQLFPWSSQSEQLVIRAASCAADEIQDWWRDSGWPSVDVLELGLPPNEVTPTANQPQIPGSLGWLERFCLTHRTRLVVITCSSAGDLAPARRLLHRLAERGGPAGLVVGAPEADWLQQFYEGVVHDRPLDTARVSVAPGVRPDPHQITLIAGSGREETLRVAAPLRRVVELADRLGRGRETPDDRLSLQWQARATDWPSPTDLQFVWSHAGHPVVDAWGRAEFNLHESDGVLPMQRAVNDLRSHLHSDHPLAVPAAEIEGPRQFIPRLRRVLSGEDDHPEEIAQRGGRLAIGEPVIMRLGAGPADKLIRVVDAVSLLEEAVFRTADSEGAWLDVAVFGLTASVVGEPIQQLWLPRVGPSELVNFLVTPDQQHPIWRVRICVYRDNLLLQSLLLAAAPDGAVKPPDRRGELLGRTLGLSPGEPTEDRTWLARLEYSITADELVALPTERKRVFSIAANTLENVPALMLKGHDLAIKVELPGDTGGRVALVREELTRAATPPNPDPRVKPEHWGYGFADDNTGTEERFDTVMRALAWRGWTLFEKFVPPQSRQALETALAGGDPLGSVINIGQLVAEHVVPWSLVYDRSYDKNKETDATGNPLEHVACPALEPGGELPLRCGSHPACPLAESNLQARRAAGRPLVDEETVACPRHFWGFRHVIEIPAKHTKEAAAPVCGNGPVSVGVGVHHGLIRASGHLESLANSLAGVAAVAWQEGNRDALRRSISADLDLDLLYFYCHAGMLDGDGVIRVQAEGKPEGILAAANLAGDEFRHRPLVFINGCQSVGFSPETLPPFVKTLVTDRLASGLIGTEIDVWEQLATEVASTFLTFFCVEGDTAGDALRRTRLALLAKRNPLGLTYTLYALADLRLRDH